MSPHQNQMRKPVTTVLVCLLLVGLLPAEVRADSITTMTGVLPTARCCASAIWDGSNSYFFGGWDSSGKLSSIVRYNPTTDTVTTMSATLPTVRHSTSAIWDGSNAYIFGGNDGSSYL